MNLVKEFAKRDDLLDIHLVTIRDDGPHLDSLPSNVRHTRLKASHTLTSIPELTRLLKSECPDAMLVAKDRAGRAAIIARQLAGVKTRICIRLGTNLSTALKTRSKLSAWFRTAPMKHLYANVDKVIAVSDGVSSDTRDITRLPASKLVTIRNPVVTDDFFEAIDECIPHDWLTSEQRKKHPVIMGVGRLSVQKDFSTLLKAFAGLIQSAESPYADARLIILGDGGKREVLEELAAQCGFSERVLMPGFQKTPQSWLSRADLFVLSSRWEGSPNVLTEALALGTPAVSTACPSGPDEVLQNGEFGELVPVGDISKLSEAMLKVLQNPLPRKVLQSAVSEYRVDVSATHYLRVLRGE